MDLTPASRGALGEEELALFRSEHEFYRSMGEANVHPTVWEMSERCFRLLDSLAGMEREIGELRGALENVRGRCIATYAGCRRAIEDALASEPGEQR